jgi:hydrogenase/urease accessory protein HupE
MEGLGVRLVRRVCILATALIAAPSLALAHMMTTGLGPVYDGALHLLISPGDLLGLVAITLLAGLRGARAGRLTVITLTVVWFAGGLAGLSLTTPVDLPGVSVLSFVILGVLVAVDPKLPPVAVAILAGLYGALHGVLNGSALGVIKAGPLALVGIVITVLIIALLITASVVSLRPSWTRIVVRVAGSWVAAVGMLMFGWLVRGIG